MSNVAKLSGALPANDQKNGLDAQVANLINEPNVNRVGFVVFKTKSINEDVEHGTKVPTIGIERFEPICTLDELPDEIGELIVNAAAKRTGGEPLPLDPSEIVED
ncbi:hypothetical protein GCM10008944_01380 [Cytobacillus oceanisediminis]